MSEIDVDRIADRVFSKIIDQYESEIKFDLSGIKSNEDFFKYIDHRMEALRAHNERYVTDLVKQIVLTLTLDKD